MGEVESWPVEVIEVEPPLDPPVRRKPPRNEAQWWRQIRDDWKRYRGGPRGTPQFLPRRVEVSTAGWPDVLVQDTRAPGIVAWVELKVARRPAGWPAVSTAMPLGIRPEQALWLQEWRKGGGHASLLVGFSNFSGWLYFPVRLNPAWPRMITRPKDWIACPHLVGLGPVPPPALLNHLPADGSTYEFITPLAPLALKVIEWPPHREGA